MVFLGQDTHAVERNINCFQRNEERRLQSSATIKVTLSHNHYVYFMRADPSLIHVQGKGCSCCHACSHTAWKAADSGLKITGNCSKDGPAI